MTALYRIHNPRRKRNVPRSTIPRPNRSLERHLTKSAGVSLYPDERRTNKTKPWQAFAISKKENIITIPSTEVGIYS